eukprot:TRINITY_DN7413_c0_g2_i1.p1 TRINITY_DN7413_c0_g2~~TRINITY_DN7413_c0_g2_i1.p1  ORF type:complete len:198 (+),score=38.04 TRINITY_DN7413_c0_g2_i1:110-703(+)
MEKKSVEREAELQQAIKCLNKPFAKRTESDIEFLRKFTEHVEFFHKLTNEHGLDTFLNCLRYLTHLAQAKDEVVFEIGSVGTLFYIVLVGRVGVFVPEQIQPAAFTEEVTLNPRVSRMMKRGTIVLESLGEPRPGLKLVKESVAGESFGELALMNNKPRKATIRCLEDCHFATLENCLLYTSPSPRDRQKSRMPSSA